MSIEIIDDRVICDGKELKRGDTYTLSCKECGKEVTKKYYSLKEFSYMCSSCKRKNTLLEEHGVENISQLETTKNKIKENNIKKYGVESHNSDPEVIKKKKETLKRNYGSESAFLFGSKEHQEIIKEKYGVDSPQKNKKIKEKTKRTNIEKYGVESLLCDNDFKKQKMKQKYGVEHSSYNKETIQKRKSTFSKKTFNDLKRFKNIKPLFEQSDWAEKSGKYSKFNWECLECGTTFSDYYANGRLPRCQNCYPKNQPTSKYEDEIVDFLYTINVTNIQRNKRDILEKKEIDIYLPDYKLGIEFNGLYWHSETNSDKKYHLNKTLECEKLGITLLHIFEDEWIEKKNIVKNIIKARLGLFDYKVYARKCALKEVDNQKEFLQEYHIQGYIPAKINIGLYYNNDLISLLTFGKSRFNKGYDWEILRYVNKSGYSIVGGFAKMLKYFRGKYLGSIITYSDRRYFDGGVYLNNGFKKLNPSNPNYYYTDYKSRYSRQQFQKHKLKDKIELFNEDFTEWENMQMNGWDRIWDCGNNVFAYLIQEM